MTQEAEILNPLYWQERIRQAPPNQFHHSIFKCNPSVWQKIEEKHREILAKHIKPIDSIFDAGCGWGRLLDLLPEEWHGVYLGLDISPDFIDMAHKRFDKDPKYTNCQFMVGDLRFVGQADEVIPKMNWAVLISIRPMIKRHLGDEEWAKIDTGLHRIADKLLFLEYDADDEGSVE